MASPDGMSLRCRAQLRAKNHIANVRSLAGSLRVVVFQPLMIDLVEMLKAEASNVIRALFLEYVDTAFGIQSGEPALTASGVKKQS